MNIFDPVEPDELADALVAVDVIRRRVARRGRRRRLTAAAALATIVAIAAVGVRAVTSPTGAAHRVDVTGPTHQRAISPLETAGPEPAAVPAGPTALYVLTGVRCGRTVCDHLARTTDAGATYTAASLPTGATHSDQIDLTFATARVGVLTSYGHATAGEQDESVWTTADGAATWQQVNLPAGAVVLGAAVSATSGFVGILPCTQGQECDCRNGSCQLMRIPLYGGAASYARLPAIYASNDTGMNGPVFEIVASGDTVWTLNGRQGGEGARSRDDGRTFTALPTAGDLAFQCSFAAVSSTVLWAACTGVLESDPQGPYLQEYRSVDSGKHFSLVWKSDVDESWLPVSPTLVFTVRDGELSRSENAGRTFTPVGPLPGRWHGTPLDCQPTLATNGRGMALCTVEKTNATLAYRTSDDGATWTPTGLPG